MKTEYIGTKKVMSSKDECVVIEKLIETIKEHGMTIANCHEVFAKIINEMLDNATL